MPQSPASVTNIEQLYRDYQPWLRSWLTSKLGGNGFSAADIAQDVFLRLLVMQHQNLLIIEQPHALLKTIAQRIMVSRWRREELERNYLEALAQQPEAYALSPEAHAILMETLSEVDQLLDALQPAVKQAFLLSQLDGLRHAEIAQTMGISIPTVKRYLRKAAMQCYFSESAQLLLAQRATIY